MSDEASDVTSRESHKILAYSNPNGRKTEQIRHLIRRYGQENVGIVSGEHGLGTIRGDITEEMVFNVESPRHAREAYAWAKKRYLRPDAWVCIDGASSIMTMLANYHFDRADRAMEWIVTRGSAGNMDGDLKLYQRYVTQKGGVFNVDAMAIYGLLGREAERFWGAWVRAPWNLYANFWEEKVGQGDRERTLPYGPDVPGRMGLAAVRGSFDYIIRLRYDAKGELIAVVRCDPDIAVTKMREDRCLGIEIPDTVENFNLADFIEALTPAQKEEN